MTLVKYRPARHRSPFNDLFDEFLNFPIGQTLGSNHVEGFAPKVNITEGEKAFELELITPGFDKKDINITVEDKVLVIAGETKEEDLKENERFTRKEFKISSFTRRFTLPENISEADIKAQSKNGLLRISLPKAEPEAKVSKRISIK